jgi:hypothetical protein
MSMQPVLPPRSIIVTRQRFGYKVSPGTFRVTSDFGEGEQFVIRNRSGATAEFTFPAGAILDANSRPVLRPVVVADGPSHDTPLSVASTYDVPWSEYDVKLQGTGLEAFGHSRPDIEIVR